MIASATDLTFSLYGYSAVIGNDFLTALYLILVKNTPATAGLTTTGLLFYNAALSLPILGIALAASNEPAGIAAYPDAHSWGFRVCCLLLVLHACSLTDILSLSAAYLEGTDRSAARPVGTYEASIGISLDSLLTSALRAGCSCDVLYVGPDHQSFDLYLHTLQ